MVPFLDRRAQKESTVFGPESVKVWYVRIPKESSVYGFLFGGNVLKHFLKILAPKKNLLMLHMGIVD